MEKIKVGMIAPDLMRNGITTVIMNYCRNFDFTMFSLTLLVGNNIDPEYKKECLALGVKIIDIPCKYESAIEYYKKLYNIINAKEFDIIHIHGNSSMIVPELAIAKIRGIKTVIAHSHNTTCDHKVLNSILKPIFLKLYTYGIACSEPAGKWMFGKRKFTVINNGIDTNRFEFNEVERKNFRKKLSVNDEPLIGHIGYFNEQKNQKFLIEFFNKLAALDKRVKLILVGNGKNFELIKNMVEKSKYKDRIILYGNTTKPYMIYNAIDLFLLPSLFEGLPLVLVEAQASGLECIASSNITENADLTSNVKFLSIENPEIWVEYLQVNNKKIMKYDRLKESKICCKKIKSKGFDSGFNTQKLMKIYKEQYFKNNDLKTEKNF